MCLSGSAPGTQYVCSQTNQERALCKPWSATNLKGLFFQGVVTFCSFSSTLQLLAEHLIPEAKEVRIPFLRLATGPPEG